MEYEYVGKGIAVSHSRAKACGTLPFACDIQLPRMLHMKLVLSPVAHGIVRHVDALQALALPGVAAVISCENAPMKPYNRGRVRASEEACDQETLFSRHVRFVGDRVAAVLAETPELALRAAALVKLDIEPLPAVMTPEAALAHPEIRLHEQDSVVRPGPVIYGDYDSAGGEVFVHRSSSQRISHISMETHCAVADYNPGLDRMTVWTPTQSTFGARSAICTLLDMTMSRVRVIKTPMGGSFGGKQEMILEPLAAYASKVTGRPVKLQLSRREAMLCTVVKHPLTSEMEVKFSPDRRINGLSLRVVLDAGAYQGVTPDYCISMSKKLSWVYDIENVSYFPVSVCTNTPVSGGYRGWGGPETTMLMENMMNAAARHFGMDPVELRLRNILPPYAVSRIGNFSLGNLPLEQVLRLGCERFRWTERRARTASQDRSGRYLRGVGMALATHTSGYFPRKPDWGTVVAKMEEDGSVQINCNVHDHGCGEVGAFQQIAAEVLSLPMAKIDILEGDTAYNALDNGCYTSRSVYVLGNAVKGACEKLLGEVDGYAAELLGCAKESLTHKNGTVFVRTNPDKCLTYSQIAYHAADHGRGALFVSHTHIPESNPGPASAHFAEVEVDTLTGLCRVVDYTAVHDVGRAINPASCRAQVGSAVQQGMGIVFCEKLEIDPATGRAKNADLQRYHVARAYDMPSLDITLLELPDENGPYGAKSIGESCYVPVAPTLIAAVNDALQTDLTALPLTPTVILSALKQRRGSAREEK